MLYLTLLILLVTVYGHGDHDHDDDDSSPKSRRLNFDGSQEDDLNTELLSASKTGAPVWTPEKLHDLLGQGASLTHARDEENGFSVLHWMANNGWDIKNFPLWRYVLSRNDGRALVHATDDEDATPLHRAAINNCLAIAEYLLEFGADIEATDKHGFTPLHYSIRFARKETALMLIEKGADVNVPVNSTNPQTAPLPMAKSFAKSTGDKGTFSAIVKALKKRGAK